MLRSHYTLCGILDTGPSLHCRKLSTRRKQPTYAHKIDTSDIPSDTVRRIRFIVNTVHDHLRVGGAIHVLILPDVWMAANFNRKVRATNMRNCARKKRLKLLNLPKSTKCKFLNHTSEGFRAQGAGACRPGSGCHDIFSKGSAFRAENDPSLALKVPGVLH